MVDRNVTAPFGAVVVCVVMGGALASVGWPVGTLTTVGAVTGKLAWLVWITTGCTGLTSIGETGAEISVVFRAAGFSAGGSSTGGVLIGDRFFSTTTAFVGG